MIEVLVSATLFLVLECTEGSHEGPMESGDFLEKKKRATARGYYGYPVVPYGEPLTILAGLAFIAYIIQAFHALYQQQPGVAGGILNNVLPGKGKLFYIPAILRIPLMIFSWFSNLIFNDLNLPEKNFVWEPWIKKFNNIIL